MSAAAQAQELGREQELALVTEPATGLGLATELGLELELELELEVLARRGGVKKRKCRTKLRLDPYRWR